MSAKNTPQPKLNPLAKALSKMNWGGGAKPSKEGKAFASTVPDQKKQKSGVVETGEPSAEDFRRLAEFLKR